MSNAFSVGQQVVHRFNRWTPDGWEPVEEIGVVINPCVQNDPDYAGLVEVKSGAWINHSFVDPADLSPVVENTTSANEVTEDAILRLQAADELRGRGIPAEHVDEIIDVAFRAFRQSLERLVEAVLTGSETGVALTAAGIAGGLLQGRLEQLIEQLKSELGTASGRRIAIDVVNPWETA